MRNCILIFFTVLAVQKAAGQNIVAGEYFIDTDPGFGNAVPYAITAAADGAFTFNVNLAGAAVGYHKLYTRTKDENGRWGQTVRKDIEVLANDLSPNIISGEYFIDTDPGFGSGKAFDMADASDGAFSFDASPATLSRGYHKLYIRTKDSNGKWGITTRKDIGVIEYNPPLTIAQGEYFFDTDPGFGNATAFAFNPIDSNVSKTFDVPVPCTNMSESHQVFFRVKDAKGDWGLTTYSTFLPKDPTTVTTIKMGLWSDASIWSNGKVPTANTLVILNHNEIIVDIDAVCFLLRTNCKNITVNNGKKLLITGH